MRGRDRFEEIDVIRGVAVTVMVLYHAAFDLNALGVAEVMLHSPSLELLADVTAGTFFGLVGLSLHISFDRASRRVRPPALWRKYFARGGKLLLLGGVITGLTFFLYPEAAVLFGALHFIGTSIVIGYLLLLLLDRVESWLKVACYLFVAALSASASWLLEGLGPGSGFTLPFGLPPEGFQSLDYYPIFPWFGAVAGGLLAAELFYPGGERRLEDIEFSVGPLELLGRNALMIYFLHQPLLYLGIVAYLEFCASGVSGSIPAVPDPFW